MTDFVLDDETHCVRKMLTATLESKKKLSAWETRFINSLLAWEGNFTQSQSETAVRLCMGDYRPQPPL